MNMFHEALKIGEENAQLLETNNGEIEYILSEFFKAINEFTQGKVTAKIEKYDKSINTIYEGYAREQAIILSGKNVLVFWQQNPRVGYPCIISRGINSCICGDKESLISELSSLLQDGFVIKTIKEMIAND